MDLSQLNLVIEYLINNMELPIQYKNHYLIGDYYGYLECHLDYDWLLIYSIDYETKIIYLARTGTHSDLFE